MNCPLVSICVPVYGVERYIERCARSLFEQSYQNIEYVFVNDSTKDASIEILQTILNDYPNRKDKVKIIHHEKNRGLGAARNTAVANASGDFLIWVDSDDFIDIYCVEKAVAKQNECRADVVNFNTTVLKKYTRDYIFHPQIVDKEAYCLDLVRLKAPYQVWSRLIRTSLYKDNNIKVLEGANFGEDLQVTGILCYYAKKIVTLDEILYFYDCSNEGSYTNNFSESKLRQSWMSHDAVIKNFEGKEQKYQKAIRDALIYRAVAHLIVSVKIKNGKCFYEEARRRLESEAMQNDLSLPRSKRVILRLYKHAFFMRMYVRLVLLVKNLRFFKAKNKNGDDFERYMNKKSRLLCFLYQKAANGGRGYGTLFRIYTKWLGVEMSSNSIIGENLRIYHDARSTVINPGTLIGANVCIRHNTTIGSQYFHGGKCPIIEDWVEIGPNVCIIGDVTIGHHSVIGAGAVVTKSVPAYSVVVGNPAQVKKRITKEEYIKLCSLDPR